MNTRILNVWETLRATFWFVPTLMTTIAAMLSVGLIALDEAIQDRVLEHVGWVWTGGPEGARALLSTVAGSMITVAGVVFSITIVALSLASSQFGPRLLRNFMRDRGNQLVLGTFIATFVYCLLVLRTIRSGDGHLFVPAIAITGGLVLAMASLGVLIYFIHHVSASIQVTHLITVVSQDLHHTIERLFPLQPAAEESKPQRGRQTYLPEQFETTAQPLGAAQSGYLQAIDGDRLMELAVDHDLIVRVTRRPGHFVIRGDALAMVWPANHVDEALAEKLRKGFIVGAERTLTQDVEFAVDQLVEVAVRALSPGMNDPFTAMACIDRLAEALCDVAERTPASASRCDDHGQLRVVDDPVTFAGLTDAAFNQIRQYGRTSAAVSIRLLESIASIAVRSSREEDRVALLHHAQMIQCGAQEALPEACDRQVIEVRYRATEQALKRTSAK